MDGTSIQYQLTNNRLFYEIYMNWKEFDQELVKGPDNMVQYLYRKWYEVKEVLKKSGLKVNDMDKEVSEKDFGATAYKTNNGIQVFFFSFPNCDFVDASSKYVALALTPSIPRYFTFEYSMSMMTKEKSFVFGEFSIKDHQKTHHYYGQVSQMDFELFLQFVMDQLEMKEKE